MIRSRQGVDGNRIPRQKPLNMRLFTNYDAYPAYPLWTDPHKNGWFTSLQSVFFLVPSPSHRLSHPPWNIRPMVWGPILQYFAHDPPSSDCSAQVPCSPAESPGSEKRLVNWVQNGWPLVRQRGRFLKHYNVLILYSEIARIQWIHTYHMPTYSYYIVFISWLLMIQSCLIVPHR